MALLFKRGPGKAPVQTAVQSASLPTPDTIDNLHRRIYAFLKENLGYVEAQKLYLAGQKIHDMNERTLFYSRITLEVERRLRGEQSATFSAYADYKWQPVDFVTFVTDPYYLNKAKEIYPAVLAAGAELNSGKYVEAVLTGGIGSGKTTLALYTNAYQLYLLSCYRSPHRMFGLDPSSEILLVFQSITKHLAQGLDYTRFRDMIKHSIYFKERYPFREDLSSKLVFPNRVEIVPISGSDTAAIGQNVMGGLIDELNYMAVIENSKSSVDGGTYDQAVAVYNSIARRRKSRFMEQGKLPGILCLVSSKKYPGQFTDIKMEEAKKDATIYVYDKRVWDIKPESFGKAGWFNVFAGDMGRKPRILAEDEVVADEDRHLVMRIPGEYKVEFEKDIINALREIAGVSTLARHPFFVETDKVGAAFKAQHESVFSERRTDFVDMPRLELVPRAIKRKDLPRFAHVDLAISGDSAGIAIGTVIGFKQVDMDTEGDSGTVPVYMPKILIDGVLEVKPPRNSEILFSKIRQVLILLKEELKLNIRWVTFDQFQSTDSQQILRQRGFITGQQSIDTLPCHPYKFLKSAFYEHRIILPTHEHLQKELLALEVDTKTGKIDHPPAGSKDCADALAGVVYGLTMRREVWMMHDVPMARVPDAIMRATDRLKAANDQPVYQDVQIDHLDRIRARAR